VIASMAVETGIAPQHLMDAPPGMLEAMHDYMVRRAQEAAKN
jgi:hypothetical protein